MMQENGSSRESAGLYGVYPMLFSFFDDDDELSRQAICAQVDAMAQSGVDGVAILGLASECNKLTTKEKRQFLEWAADALGGRLPLSVTVSENTVRGQIEFAKAAAASGASWVVLQPPPVKQVGEAALMQFFAAVAERCETPVGLQIAPEFFDSSISFAGLRALCKQQPNIAILKVEMPAIDIAELIEATEGAFSIFNGRAGLELPDCIEAGCVGIIPGMECADVLAQSYGAATSTRDDRQQRAQERYNRVAPFLVATDASLDRFLTYAKRLAVRRLGLAEELARLRMPCEPASDFGIRLIDQLTAGLGPFPSSSHHRSQAAQSKEEASEQL